jgi:hypothetical protein
MEMEGTGDGSVEEEDPLEWSSQKVASFLRALGTAEYFQSAADQVLQLGVDDSLFCKLSVIELEGVCGHAGACHRMCEFTQNSTDARAITVAQTDHS